MWPSDCSQVRWSARSTQAAAAAGQDLRALGLSARLLAAAAGPPMAGAGLPVAAAGLAEAGLLTAAAGLLVAGTGLPVAGTGLPVAAATASGIAQAPADGSPAAATCPASAEDTTRGTLSPGRWPPCQPIATVPATSRKARTAVNRYLAVAMEQTYTNGPVTAAGAPTDASWPPAGMRGAAPREHRRASSSPGVVLAVP